MDKKKKIKNTKKRIPYKTVFIIVLMAGAIGGVKADPDYYIFGNVSDSSCGISADGHTVIAWYDNEVSYSSDIIGPLGNSGVTNRYMIEVEAGIPGYTFKPGDTLQVKVIDNGDGCTAGPVEVITLEGTPAEVSDMTLDCETKGKLIMSCNESGYEKNEFVPGQKVYVRGEGLLPETEYTIWIQHEPVAEGQMLNPGDDPSPSQNPVTSDATGNFGPTLIWDIPSDAPATREQWDIVVDKEGESMTGSYNKASDDIDSATTYGFLAPVPELATITLIGVGLIALFGYKRFSKIRE